MAELIQRTDTLNQGREKLNEAIKDAEQAKNTSAQADDKATQALAKSESTQTQLDTIVIEGDSSVEAAQARVDETGGSHPTLKARIDDGFTEVKTRLAEKAEIKVFENTPSPSELSIGDFGFVRRYDPLRNYNLSLQEVAEAEGRPQYWSKHTIGGGTKVYEVVNSPAGAKLSKAQKIRQNGGNDGQSNYTNLRGGNTIPLDGSQGIVKSDLINFRFSVYPIAAECYTGLGSYNGGINLSLRNVAGTEIGEITGVFMHGNFTGFGNTNKNIANVESGKWTTVQWDIYSELLNSNININDVDKILMFIRSYTNHSTASSSFLINDLKFVGVNP